MTTTDNELLGKFNEVLQTLEKDTSNLRYSHQRADKFREIYKFLEEKGQVDSELAKQVLWEIMLFDFVLKPRSIRWRGSEGKVFSPLCGFSNGRSYPDQNDFNDASFEYFKKRALETKNPIHKCRYCDAVWTLKENRKDDEKYKYAQMAIDAYLECAGIYFENIPTNVRWGLEFTHSLQRATELIPELGKAAIGKATEVKLKILHFMDDLFKNGNYRWCLDLTRTILQHHPTPDEINKLIQINKQSANDFKSGNDFHFHRAFLVNLIDIYKHAKKQDLIPLTKKEIAESYKLEGDYAREHRPHGNLVAASYYEEAAQKYRDLGMKDNVDKLASQIEECYKLAEPDFGVIGATVEIPSSEIDSYINELSKLTPKEALRQISADNSLIPSIEKATLKSDEDKILYPLTTRFPSTSLRETKKVYDSVKSDDPLEHNVRRNLLFQIQFVKITLSLLFEKLKQKAFLTREILMEFFAESGNIEKENLEIINVGIERYFKEDYVSALHVFIPQLEGVLRKMLSNVIQVTKIGTKRMQVMTLNEILKKEEVWINLGDDFTIYLYLVLVSQQGLNLRNDIAHGFVKKDDCAKEIANIILHMLIVLTSFELKKTEVPGRE